MRIKVQTEEKETPRRIDEIDADTTLIGFSSPGADEGHPQWHIKKIVKVGTVTSFLYPNGNEDEIVIWSDRLTYVYS